MPLAINGPTSGLANVLLEFVLAEDFADVDVATRVDPDAVWRVGELVGRVAFGSPARQDFAVQSHDRDPLASLGQIKNVISNKGLHRSVEIAPFTEVGAIAIEVLNSLVLTVANEHAIARVDPDVMRQGELARSDTFLAPRGLELAIGTEPVDSPLPVSIGHVHLAVRSDERVGWLIERLPRGAGAIGCAPALEELAVARPPGDEMRIAVGEIQLVSRAHPDAVGMLELPAAPLAK